MVSTRPHDPTGAAADPDAGTVGVSCGETGGTEVEAFAPGRVNLIGEHTDYTGGLALPVATQMGTTVTGVRISGGGPAGIVVDSQVAAGTVTIALGDDGFPVGDPRAVAPPWGRYVAGVAAGVAHRGQLCGIEGQVATTLAVGAGLSSSAALEVAVALAVGFVGTRGDLAALARHAEHEATGVPCGLMDQLASACGVAGHALRIDFTSLDVTAVPVPEDIEIVVVHSGRQRTLVGSAYADRRRECEQAAAIIGPLAAAGPQDAASVTDPVLRRRARHVTSENERVEAMVAALGCGDAGAAGEILQASHESLAGDFEVSVPELDDLVARLNATPGVFGSRLTGAGFGGCVVALCEPGALTDNPDPGFLAAGLWPVVPSGGAWVRTVGR